MYNYAAVIVILQSGCHYIILQVLVWKWHFDTDWILPLVSHLVHFHSWYVIFFLFSDSAHNKIYVDIYLKTFGCILVLYYMHIRFNNTIIRNVSCSFLLYIKMKNIKSNIYPNEVSVVNTESSLKVKRVILKLVSAIFLKFIIYLI